MGESVHDVFLAYAGPDREAARQLWRLLAPRCRPFLDVESLRPGEAWDSALPAAMAQARLTVILISAHTEQAWYLRDEIALAVERAREPGGRHRVVPVFLQGGDSSGGLPYGLRRLKPLFVDDGGLEAVAEALMGMLPGAAPAAASDELGPPRVLVLDDESLIAELIADQLRERGLEVRVTVWPNEAREIALTFRPHVVVIDYQLWSMTGVEVVESLRRDRATPFGVVFYTRYARSPEHRNDMVAPHLGTVEIVEKSEVIGDAGTLHAAVLNYIAEGQE